MSAKKAGRPSKGLSRYGDQADKYRNSTFRLGKDADDQLDRMAAAYNVSRSKVARYAVSVLYAQFLAGLPMPDADRK